MAHAKLFSPSAADRWMVCHGAPALERRYPASSSKYADEGTAAHTLGSDSLTNKVDATHYLGRVIAVDTTDNDGSIVLTRHFTVDEDMARHVQTYLDLVRSYVAIGYTLLIEQRVSFQAVMQALNDDDSFGTSDAILISPDGTHLVVIDLKYGMGVKVYAQDNRQMKTYGLATMETFDVLGSFDNVTLIVCQPRIDHIDEWDTTREVLEAHGKEMLDSSMSVKIACEVESYEGVQAVMDKGFLVPGEKQCRFCRANADCPGATAAVAETVFADFAALDSAHIENTLLAAPPAIPEGRLLGLKAGLLDQIENWVKAVRTRVDCKVLSGEEVIGPDDLPMKVVEGKKGDRAWIDKVKAEGLLVSHLSPEKAYEPRKIITPSAAGKFLDKKKSAETWKVFKENITQADGKPKVVLGSDSRPVFKVDVEISDFADLSDPTE